MLLREIAAMQKELGTCRCSGRDAARAAAAALPSPANLSQTVILIRHGEKDGGDDLDARGYTRAYCLSSRFAAATHLYAYTDKDTRRPVETLTPLAGPSDSPSTPPSTATTSMRSPRRLPLPATPSSSSLGTFRPQ